VLVEICEPLDKAPAEPDTNGETATVHEPLVANGVKLGQNEPLSGG